MDWAIGLMCSIDIDVHLVEVIDLANRARDPRCIVGRGGHVDGYANVNITDITLLNEEK